MKVCLYLEFYHFWNGRLFKNLGTGLLSSYKNQKKILDRLHIPYAERWDDACDLLQVNTPWLKSLWLMRRAKRQGKPVIVWAHVTAEDMRGVFRFSYLLAPLMKKYLTYAYNQADLILTPSDYTRDLIIGYGLDPAKIKSQSNGVELTKFIRRPIAHSGLTVGTVALAIPRKGIDTFLFLAERFPALQFTWAGKIYSSLLTKPLPKVLPANVRFSGYVPDIVAAYNSFDTFIFPSYEENQGMVILEAAASGLPILVRDIPVYRGWLVDGENCLKAKDNADFALKLKQLIEDRDLRVRLSQAALKLAAANSLPILGERLQKLYLELISAKANSKVSSGKADKRTVS